ncbi:hypothetical protein [Enterobacter mori]
MVLERQPGADAEGFAGLQDGVDYHWSVSYTHNRAHQT